MPNTAYPEAYGPAEHLSTRLVTAARWRLVFAALFGSAALSLAVMLFVLAGGADVKRGYTQAFPVDTAKMIQVDRRDGFAFHSVSALNALPMLFEVQLIGVGAWGVWVGPDADSAQVLLVDARGYTSAELPGNWRPFIHVDTDANRLSAEVTISGVVHWRVNDEIVMTTTASTDQPLHVGTVIPLAAHIRTRDAALYTTRREQVADLSRE